MQAVEKVIQTVERPRFVKLLIETGQKWSSDNVPRLSAAVSFYAALSLAPFAILATVLMVYWLNTRPESSHGLVTETQSTFGVQAAYMLAAIIKNSQKHQGAGIVASIGSFVVMFYSASNLFLQFDDSIQAIWNVKRKESFVRAFIQGRLLAFASVAVAGAALIAWLVLDSRLASLAQGSFRVETARILSFLTALVVLSCLCLLSMKRLPEVKLQWSDVWPGALMAAFAITVAKYLLTLYFAKSSIANIYGPAGSLLIVLLWIYYCAQIYFFGTEFVYVYAHKVGSLAGSIESPVKSVPPTSN